jgi:exopolysaccharide production protein ExoZ
MERKLYSIQYLRGMAAISVVIAHAGAHPISDPSYILDRLGQLGVTLFFVISGFIMVAITGTGRLNPVEFVLRRVMRVAPLYWVFTSLAAALALTAPSLFKNTVFTLPHFVQSLLFVPHESPGTGSTSPLLSLGWTLNYEMFFYLCFACCAWFMASTRVTVLTLAFVGLSVAGLLLQPMGSVFAFYANPSLLAFCAGAWVGLAYVHGRISALPPASVGIGIGAAVLGLLCAFVADRNPSAEVFSFAALIVSSVAIVVAGVRGEGRWPRSRLLEKLGDASYATYLVHMFVVGAVAALVGRLLGFANPLVYVGSIAVAVLVATIVGILVHEWLEKPMLRWLRGTRPSAPPASTAKARA